MKDHSMPNTLGPFADRQGRRIDESMWSRLRATPGYHIVRRYTRSAALPGPAMWATLRWWGYPFATPLSLQALGYEDLTFATEKEAVDAYEHILVTKGCGEWTKSQMDDTYHFHTTGNEHSDAGPLPVVVDAMVENENYASW